MASVTFAAEYASDGTVTGKPLTDPYESAWAAGVEEKARRMGLKL